MKTTFRRGSQAHNAELEASKSVWMDVAPLRTPALEISTKADVAIVGAGICGISIAYELITRGISVTILERGKVARGISARTSAHLTFQSDDLYQEVISRRGKRIAKLHYESQRAAVDRIESIVTKEKIACQFQRLDGILGLARGQKPKILEEELKACQRLGYAEVRWAKKSELSRLRSTRGLCFPQQARFHPTKYMHALIRKILKRGGKVYSHSPVIDLKETSRGVNLTVANGHLVRARIAVIATNSPIEPKLALHSKQTPYRTYVIGVEVPKGAVGDALYWDTLDPYHYVRLQPGQRADILIAGGEDHRTGDVNDAQARFRKIESWMRRRFPEAGAVKCQWSGQTLDPIDYTAFIGHCPGRKRTFLATGDSGQGLTHGVIASLLLADFIQGKSSPWEAVYDPKRRTLSAAGRYLADNLTVAKNMLSYLKPGEMGSIKRLKPGDGAIFQHGLEKLAVCRDLKGRIHIHSASCTHLGCLLTWNGFEQCWDCQCHGSHFSANGDSLNAPAVAPLTKARVN